MNQKRSFRDHPGFTMLAKGVADLLLMLATAYLAFRLTYAVAPKTFRIQESTFFALVLLLFTFEQLGLYRVTRSTSLGNELEIMSTGWIISISLFTGYMWLSNRLNGQSLKWLVLWLVFGWVAMATTRLLMRRLLTVLRRRGINVRTVVIAVASDLGVQVARELTAKPELGIRVLGYAEDRSQERRTPMDDLPVLGSVDDLASFVDEHRIDEVWIALPFRAEDRIRRILDSLRHSTADVCLVPDVFQFYMLNQSMGEVGGIPLIGLNASPMQGGQWLVKAIEDRILGFLILVLISPIMLVVAAFVWFESPHLPIFFKQQRRGLRDEVFEVWKFRTMRPHFQAAGTYTLATKGDARVTPIGAILRRTSLDELPQFLNVLRGNMSIVGPRPYPIEINDVYKNVVDRYMLRHKVKPGITGWAQVNGLRGALDTPEKMERRVQHDLYYIEHWSLWFDLKIVALTIVKGFVNENAY